LFKEGASLMSNNPSNQDSNFPRGLSNPALSALAQGGYKDLQQLTQATEAEILKLHGMGPKGIRILKEAMGEKGLVFAEPKR
jgi:DNA-directed RNA polymerase alpha subunit